ncbi:unnamed protein product, partial [Vitis vinifera]
MSQCCYVRVLVSPIPHEYRDRTFGLAFSVERTEHAWIGQNRGKEKYLGLKVIMFAGCNKSVVFNFCRLCCTGVFSEGNPLNYYPFIGSSYATHWSERNSTP